MKTCNVFCGTFSVHSHTKKRFRMLRKNNVMYLFQWYSAWCIYNIITFSPLAIRTSQLTLLEIIGTE